MHKNYFSEIRSHLLSSSSAIIQDDSGIPIKHFPNNRWNIQFFGKYTAPIDLFKEHYQSEMKDLSEKFNFIINIYPYEDKNFAHICYAHFFYSMFRPK